MILKTVYKVWFTRDVEHGSSGSFATYEDAAKYRDKVAPQYKITDAQIIKVTWEQVDDTQVIAKGDTKEQG